MSKAIRSVSIHDRSEADEKEQQRIRVALEAIEAALAIRSPEEGRPELSEKEIMALEVCAQAFSPVGSPILKGGPP